MEIVGPSGQFTHEPRAVTMKIVRAQEEVSKGRPKTPSDHVVWSSTPKFSVMSYVTLVLGPSANMPLMLIIFH